MASDDTLTRRHQWVQDPYGSKRGETGPCLFFQQVTDNVNAVRVRRSERVDTSQYAMEPLFRVALSDLIDRHDEWQYAEPKSHAESPVPYP
jgi:hypothetical protein